MGYTAFFFAPVSRICGIYGLPFMPIFSRYFPFWITNNNNNNSLSDFLMEKKFLAFVKLVLVSFVAFVGLSTLASCEHRSRAKAPLYESTKVFDKNFGITYGQLYSLVHKYAELSTDGFSDDLALEKHNCLGIKDSTGNYKDYANIDSCVLDGFNLLVKSPIKYNPDVHDGYAMYIAEVLGDDELLNNRELLDKISLNLEILMEKAAG